MSDDAYRPGTTQTVTYTGTAAASTNAFPTGVFAVRIVATSACFIAFGAAPTATTAGVYLPIGIPEVFRVTPGQKVSAVQASAGGSIYVTELS